MSRSAVVLKQSSPDNPTIEPSPFTGEQHRIYLLTGCTASGNLVTNSGAAGTTDWVDSNSDGLADDWSIPYYSSQAQTTIVTGNGFSGNAQRIQNTGSTITTFAIAYSTPIIYTGFYKVTFRYRSSADMDVMYTNNPMNTITDWCGGVPGQSDQSAEYEVTCRPANPVPAVGYLLFGFYSTGVTNAWIEIDNVVVTSNYTS